MDYGVADLGLPMESMSNYSLIDTLANATANSETFPLLDSYPVNSCLPSLPKNTHKPRINVEACPLVSCPHISLVLLYWSIQFTSIVGSTNEGAAGTLHPESPVTIRGLLDFMSQGTSPSSLMLAKPPLRELEDLGPALVISNEDPICNWSQEGMGVPPDQSHQYTRVDNDSPQSTLPSMSPNVRRQEQSESRDWPRQFQTTGEGPAAASSPSPTQLEKKNLCNCCGRGFAQLQGLKRHQREVHLREVSAKSCEYRDCGFKWLRRYIYKEHKKSCHSDGVHRNKGLEERRRDHTVSLLPPPGVGETEHPLMAPPALLLVDYNPQPESAEPLITRKRRREDVRPSEVPDSTYSHSPFPSAEERSQMEGMPTRGVQHGPGLRRKRQSVRQGTPHGSFQSMQRSTHSEYHGDLIHASPMVGLSEPACFRILPSSIITSGEANSTFMNRHLAVQGEEVRLR